MPGPPKRFPRRLSIQLPEEIFEILQREADREMVHVATLGRALLVRGMEAGGLLSEDED